MTNKLKKLFTNLVEKIKISVRMKKESVVIFFALVLIIFLGVLVRCSPIFAGPALIDAFDPWVQYNTAEYFSTHSLYDYFHWYSNQTWYPEGYARYDLRPGLIFASVGTFKILTFVGIPVTIYDVCYYWPALMGGLTILTMFFLGREILDNRSGLIAAFFLAFSPGHMQRTVVGFFDNETIGILFVLATFLFFIKSIKTGKSYHSILAGLFLGALTLTWGGFQFGLLVLPLTTLILILTGKYSPRLLNAYIGTVGIGLLIYMINPIFKPIQIISDMECAIPLLFMGFILLFHIFNSLKEKNPTLHNKIWSTIKWGSIPLIIVIGIIYWVAPDILPFSLGARASSILNPLIRNEINLVASVAEHHPAPWSTFYFNSLIPVILTPLGFYFGVKRGREEDILIMTFALSLLYTTGSMIRIILLLAPALALIGAYGLSHVLKFFGTLIGKKPQITRRRKRQIRKTMGNAEGIIVFAFVGVLFFAQINHATSTSIKMMSGTSLVTAGTFHDWEETLTFLKTNVGTESVVVSWWDYGYWLSNIGNVTTVNDNATVNHTRIGATGMAMMQTDEISSARMFQRLQADYVLVFWGYLYSGLGGDEGKWQWMVRICNDHTNEYKALGWEEDNWYGDPDAPVTTVFDENEYQNNTNGLYGDKWFESTLVKLMFYGEPTSLTSQAVQQSQLAAYYAAQIEGSESDGVSPREDVNGNTWRSHIPPDGYYDLKCFIPFYFSSNHLVKIYKVDYTALESSFILENPHLSTNGIAHVDINNTGLREISLNKVKINDITCDVSVENRNTTIPVGESRIVWINASQMGIDLEKNDYYDITAEVTADALEGRTYTFSESTEGYAVVDVPNYSIEIDRKNSIILMNGVNEQIELFINVTNDGDALVCIDGFNLNGEKINYNLIFNDATNNFLIQPGNSEEFHIYPSFNGAPGKSFNITALTAENATDKIEMTVNIPEYKLNILPEDRIIISEELINEDPDLNRRLIPIDYSKTILYENGTMYLTVKNTGIKNLSLECLYIDGVSTEFAPASGNPEDLFIDKGEEKVILLEVSDTVRNKPINVTITATGQDGLIAASDMGYIVPIVEGKALNLLSSEYTDIYANETLEIAVKNMGTENILIDRFKLNGTNFNLTNAEILFGSITLSTYDVLKFRINDLGNFKLNISNTISLNVSGGNTFDEKTFTVIAAEGYDFTIPDNSSTKGITDTDILQLCLTGSGIYNLTVDTITVNGTLLIPDDFTIESGVNIIEPWINTIIMINGTNFGHPNLITGENYQVEVVTLEGPTKTAYVEVTSS
ncbi:MAG: STT3 domain-containing protein [Promethearchaeota archaeon]